MVYIHVNDNIGMFRECVKSKEKQLLLIEVRRKVGDVFCKAKTGTSSL